MSDQVLAELKLMREHLAALVDELKARKRKGTKRARTLASRAQSAELGGHKPTELEIARARRYLKR